MTIVVGGRVTSVIEESEGKTTHPMRPPQQAARALVPGITVQVCLELSVHRSALRGAETGESEQLDGGVHSCRLQNGITLESLEVVSHQWGHPQLITDTLADSGNVLTLQRRNGLFKGSPHSTHPHPGSGGHTQAPSGTAERCR